MKKLIRVIALLCMAALLLIACAPAQTPAPGTDPPPAGGDTATPAPTGGDDGDEDDPPAAGDTFGNGATLSLAALEGWYPAVTMADNLPIWQEFERRTGVHIEWEVFSDYNTAMQPRIAAGVGLPDMMLIPPAWGNSGVYRLAQEGIIIQLDDLIAEYAPDITRLFASYPDLKGLLTAPDGNVYTIADTPKFVNDVVASAFFVRQDWLDELGLDVPATLDDWYEMLVAFQGMGPDIIPFSGALGGFNFFGSSFGLTSYTTTWWADANGRVFCQFATEEYRELLTFINRLYEEGLMDRELVRDEPNFQSLASTNVVGSFATLAGYLTLYDNLLNEVPGANHTLVTPPPDSRGDIRITKRDPVWSHYGITRDCAIPEIAIQWMNYVWGSDEGVMLNEFGIEGETFYFGDDGLPWYTDFVLNNPDGLDMYNALRSLGASNTMMVRTPMQVYIALQSESPALPFEMSIVPFRVEPFPAPMSTPEEQSVLDMVSPDFNTYIDEMRVRFITGAEPLENFDEYLATLERIGLSQLLEVQQARFDRARGR